VFGLGVIVSMLSALIVTRTLLVTLPDVEKKSGTLLAKLFGNGLGK
jgi:preprotein translocase subunit SecD